MINTCPKCGHQAESDTPLESGVFRCEGCKARLAFGHAMPRVVVSVERPHFVTLQIDDGEAIRLDPQLAASLAKNLLSVTIP